MAFSWLSSSIYKKKHRCRYSERFSIRHFMHRLSFAIFVRDYNGPGFRMLHPGYCAGFRDRPTVRRVSENSNRSERIPDWVRFFDHIRYPLFIVPQVNPSADAYPNLQIARLLRRQSAYFTIDLVQRPARLQPIKNMHYKQQYTPIGINVVSGQIFNIPFWIQATMKKGFELLRISVNSVIPMGTPTASSVCPGLLTIVARITNYE